MRRSVRPGRGPNDRMGKSAASPSAPPATSSPRRSRGAAVQHAALLEIALQRVGVFLRGDKWRAVLYVGAREQSVGPEDEPDTDPAEREADEQALELRLSPAPVGDHEGDCGCGGEPERRDDRAFSRPLAQTVRASSARFDVAEAEHEDADREQCHPSLGHGAEMPQGQAAAIVRVLEVLDIASHVGELLVADRGGAEHGHRARPQADRFDDLSRRRHVDGRGSFASQESAALTAPLVAGRALRVGRSHHRGDVAVLGMYHGDVGAAGHELADVVDEGGDGGGVVCGRRRGAASRRGTSTACARS